MLCTTAWMSMRQLPRQTFEMFPKNYQSAQNSRKCGACVFAPIVANQGKRSRESQPALSWNVVKFNEPANQPESKGEGEDRETSS